MIEEVLLNYGVLGLWTLSLIYDKLRFQTQVKNIIKNNTIAMTKVYEVISKCNKA